jgi:hypothetical protein
VFWILLAVLRYVVGVLLACLLLRSTALANDCILPCWGVFDIKKDVEESRRDCCAACYYEVEILHNDEIQGGLSASPVSSMPSAVGVAAT